MPMTEADWSSSTEPQAMLTFLRDYGKLSERKARLFACACCRTVWDSLPLPVGREAVEVGEKLADGLTTNSSRQLIRDAIQREKEHAIAEQDFHRAARLRDSQTPVEEEMARQPFYLGPWEQPWVKCGLLRDIVGPLPFRHVTILPSVRTWKDATVVRLAQAAYGQRSLPAGTLEPERLAVLADALEEAGCADQELLGHLRGTGPHVRGCWVVDLLTVRE
jgi:hypothetical protein